MFLHFFPQVFPAWPMGLDRWWWSVLQKLCKHQWVLWLCTFFTRKKRGHSTNVWTVNHWWLNYKSSQNYFNCPPSLCWCPWLDSLVSVWPKPQNWRRLKIYLFSMNSVNCLFSVKKNGTPILPNGLYFKAESCTLVYCVINLVCVAGNSSVTSFQWENVKSCLVSLLICSASLWWVQKFKYSLLIYLKSN